MRRLLVRQAVLLSFAVGVLHASSALAQCPFVSLQDAKQTATLIIAGTPTKIEPLKIDSGADGQVVTFLVDAVWKGAADRTLALYAWQTSEGIRLAIGMRYLIFAGPIRSFRSRTQEPPAELQLNDCSCRTFDEAEKMGWIRDLGPSHPPQVRRDYVRADAAFRRMR